MTAMVVFKVGCWSRRNFTYIIPTSRMISGEALKRSNGALGLRASLMALPPSGLTLF